MDSGSSPKPSFLGKPCSAAREDRRESGRLRSWALPVGISAWTGKQGGQERRRWTRAGGHRPSSFEAPPPPPLEAHPTCARQTCSYILNRARHGTPLLWSPLSDVLDGLSPVALKRQGQRDLGKGDGKGRHAQRESETLPAQLPSGGSSLPAWAPDSGARSLPEHSLPRSERPIENGQSEQVNS